MTLTGALAWQRAPQQPTTPRRPSRPRPRPLSTTTEPFVTVEPSFPDESSTNGTAIALNAGGVVMTGVLNDTRVSQDFAVVLPVTVPCFRYSGIEYITSCPHP